jgi:predicted phage-related endonuclease
VPPDPSDLPDLSILYPDDSAEPALLADPDLAAKVLRLRAIHKEITARESEAESLEFELKRAMRDVTEIVMPNGKTAVEWRQRTGSFLDETALKEAHPKIAREFTRKWAKRVFKLKPFSIEGLEP